MVVKRERDAEEPEEAAEEAAEEPAAKRHCAARQNNDTATPNATMAPQAAAELPKAATEVPVEPKATAAKLPILVPKLSTWARLQKNTLKYAESHLTYWWYVVQREKMQLQAHLDGNRRVEELQLEEIKNKDGVVVGHVDPEPDIDRLHIKVWCTPTKSMYICFLNSKFTDTIAKLKKKIQEHPDVVTRQTFKDMKVFYNGVEIMDTDTLDDKWITDDCILHAIDNVYDGSTWVLKSSIELHQWQQLLPQNLKPPDKNYNGF